MTIAVPIADAARLTKVSERTMWRWVKAGHVRAVRRRSGLLYVHLDDAIEYRGRSRASLPT